MVNTIKYSGNPPWWKVNARLTCKKILPILHASSVWSYLLQKLIYIKKENFRKGTSIWIYKWKKAKVLGLNGFKAMERFYDFGTITVSHFCRQLATVLVSQLQLLWATRSSKKLDVWLFTFSHRGKLKTIYRFLPKGNYGSKRLWGSRTQVLLTGYETVSV